jgi:hypothetical protein
MLDVYSFRENIYSVGKDNKSEIRWSISDNKSEILYPSSWTMRCCSLLVDDDGVILGLCNPEIN